MINAHYFLQYFKKMGIFIKYLLKLFYKNTIFYNIFYEICCKMYYIDIITHPKNKVHIKSFDQKPSAHSLKRGHISLPALLLSFL